jgi:hypothetical protein
MHQNRREVVEQYLRDEIRYKQLQNTIGKVAAEAVRESEKQFSKAGNLADDFADL